jgi:DNA polymerase III subunit epsilon
MTTALAPSPADLAAAAELLASSPDYRVLRRFQPRSGYELETWDLGGKKPVRLGVYVDVEGTGLDVESDEIIELSMVPFAYDAELGVVYDVREPISFLEQPKHRTISPEITEITRITPAMVEGKAINAAVVNELLSRAAICFAHNADYDRRMCERRIPGFAKLPWACTQRQIDWKKFGVNGGALGNILISACGEFTDDAHRATNDCYVGVHILAAAKVGDRTALSIALEAARVGIHRVCAIGSPIDCKGILKGRKYHALYVNDRFRYWYKDVLPDQADDEMSWCEREAYATPQLKVIPAKDAYSVRADR